MKQVYIIYPKGKPARAEAFATLKFWSGTVGLNYNTLNTTRVALRMTGEEYDLEYQGFIILKRVVKR